MDELDLSKGGDPPLTIVLLSRSRTGGPPNAHDLSGMDPFLPPLDPFRVEQVPFLFLQA